jgi:hypothetical protein
MDSAPFLAKRVERRCQRGDDCAEITTFEAEAFSQSWRSIWTMQDEHGFSARADDMNMGGTMVGRVDYDPQAAYAQNSWHC